MNSSGLRHFGIHLQKTRILRQIAIEPTRIINLRNEASISQSRLVAETEPKSLAFQGSRTPPQPYDDTI
jgi:hypothetical protein